MRLISSSLTFSSYANGPQTIALFGLGLHRFPALVGTITNLMVRSPKAVIAVATKTRHDSEAEFFSIMRNAGLIEDGNMRLPLPGTPGQGYADWAMDVGLHVFHGRDHRLSLTPRNNSDESVPKADPVPNRSKSR